MTEHTPGPWRFTKCQCGHPSCNKFRINHSGAEGMFEIEDACLIAAAPDLLAALRDTRSLAEHLMRKEGVLDATLLQQADAAIAKATKAD